MTGYKRRSCYEIWFINRLFAKTQMRHGHAAGFFRIIIEVSLRVHIRVIADNLDAVLFGPNRTVGTVTPQNLQAVM